MNTILGDLKAAILGYDIVEIASCAEKAVAAGIDINQVLSEAAIPALHAIGEGYENGTVFIPEMLMAGDGLCKVVEIYRPVVQNTQESKKGVIVMGTVQDDVHNIGLDMVSMILEGSGYEVHNLGVDVSAARFVWAVNTYGADIVGMSALLSTTTFHFGETVKALEDAGMRSQVKVMIGGVCANQNIADEIGADGYGVSAFAAVKLADSFMQGNPN